jgi:hypothetical protein
MKKVATVYLVTTAVFLSSLGYALMIYFVTTTGAVQPSARPLGDLLFYILAALTIPIAAAMLAVANVIVKAALCEAPAVFGIVAFFISGEVTHFVVLLGISVVLFVILAPQVVSHVNSIWSEAVDEWRSRERPREANW